MSHDLGTFRSLLAAPPSTESFVTICEAIDFFADDLEELTHYLQGHLSRWPEQIARPVPEMAVIATDVHHINPCIVLCNTLHAEEVLYHLDAAALEALVHSPVMGHIHTLILDDWSDSDESELLLSSKTLTSVHTLTFRHSRLLASDLLEAFARITPPWSLRTLDLRESALSTRDLAKLQHTDGLSSLEHLNLSHTRLDHESVAILDALELSSLKTLDLRHNTLGRQGAHLLAQIDSMPSLQWLDVRVEDIPSGALLLAESTTLPTPVRRYWRARCQQ